MYNISLYSVGFLVIQHFLFDWYLQSREMATKKSSEIKWLFKHCSLVFCGFFIYLLFNFNIYLSLLGASVYVIIHAFQDWNIWRLYGKIYKDCINDYWKQKSFYDFIALDQLLHFIEMLIIIYILKGI